MFVVVVCVCVCMHIQAAYLQKGGLRTAVLERRHVLGGAAVSEEIFPGKCVNSGYKGSIDMGICVLLYNKQIYHLKKERNVT